MLHLVCYSCSCGQLKAPEWVCRKCYLATQSAVTLVTISIPSMGHTLPSHTVILIFILFIICLHFFVKDQSKLTVETVIKLDTHHMDRAKLVHTLAKISSLPPPVSLSPTCHPPSLCTISQTKLCRWLRAQWRDAGDTKETCSHDSLCIWGWHSGDCFLWLAGPGGLCLHCGGY